MECINSKKKWDWVSFLAIGETSIVSDTMIQRPSFFTQEIVMDIISLGFSLLVLNSRLEILNRYSLKVEGPPDIGEFYYKGTARSIDDEKNYKTLLGLSIPHGAVKKLVQDDHYDIEVKIIDLKAEVNKAEDTQMPTSEEDE